MSNKKAEFKVTIDGKEVSLAVKAPTYDQNNKAQGVWNKAFHEATQNKAVLRLKLDDFMEEQGLWNSDKQAKYAGLQERILDGERKLKAGGIKLSDAKKIAVDMQEARAEIRELIAKRLELDVITADGQADDARFNYLVSVCLVYNNEKEQPFFKSFDEYLNRRGEEVSRRAAQELGGLLYGLDQNAESNLPENQFLIKKKFVDDKLRPINKTGHLVDSEGRLIDEKGRFINEQGQLVDKDGYLVDEQGEYLMDTKPFLDDDGNEIPEEATEPKSEQVETKEEIKS